MYNITLISTIHTEIGQCNSDELYKIIEGINPDVVFDELTINFSDMYYSDSFDVYYQNKILLNQHPPVIPLEVKCIKKYKQNYDIKIIPVDIDLTQKLSELQNEIYFMYNTFSKYDVYTKLDNEKAFLIALEGFHFLNSIKFLNFLQKKEIIENQIIESEFQKIRLLNIYKKFHAEIHENRENAILYNIYNYSKGKQYNQAVILIGAEHKKSIIQKITDYEKLSEIKLHWTMYGNE